MKVDLHGLPLSEAKLKSQVAVAKAWSDLQPKLELIHGYNLGTVIKDYIQTPEGLRRDVNQIYPEISDLILKDKGLGSTIVKFKRR